jgi:hypothetical protein
MSNLMESAQRLVDLHMQAMEGIEQPTPQQFQDAVFALAEELGRALEQKPVAPAQDDARDAVPAGQCAWQEDEDGAYDTDCGNRFEFIDGGVADNDMKFCPYCGKPVDEHYYNDWPEGE